MTQAANNQELYRSVLHTDSDYRDLAHDIWFKKMSVGLFMILSQILIYYSIYIIDLNGGLA